MRNLQWPALQIMLKTKLLMQGENVCSEGVIFSFLLSDTRLEQKQSYRKPDLALSIIGIQIFTQNQAIGLSPSHQNPIGRF